GPFLIPWGQLPSLSHSARLPFFWDEWFMRVSRIKQNVMRVVLAFLLRHWRREAWLVTGVACSMVVATIADLLIPCFAGRMVDAIAMHTPARSQSLHAALSALATMLLLGGILVVGRLLSLIGISRLTVR